MPSGYGLEAMRNARVAVITSRRKALNAKESEIIAAINSTVIHLDKLMGKKVPSIGSRLSSKDKSQRAPAGGASEPTRAASGRKPPAKVTALRHRVENSPFSANQY